MATIKILKAKEDSRTTEILLQKTIKSNPKK